MEPGSPADLDSLLANASWVRSLARQLAANPSEADDLAQEAWLRALRKPPRHTGNLRAWFGEVVRSVARSQRRSEGRRRLREQRPAPPAAEDTPTELVARAELHRSLVEAVLELPEPYRATILARYFEGRNSQQVAQRLGISDATVRSRLKRGLEMMRARLKTAWGAGWKSGCLALAGAGLGKGAAAGSVATLSIGSWIAMLSQSSKTVGAALALILVALTAFVMWEPSGPEEPGAVDPPSAAAGVILETGAVAAAANAAGPIDEQRRQIETGATILGTVRVRVTDLDGAPLEGAAVSAFRPAIIVEAMNGQSLERGLAPREGTTVVEGRCDARGEAELGRVPFGKSASLVVASHPGFALRAVRAEVEDGPKDIDLGSLALAPGTDLVLRVHSAGGLPVKNAKVELETEVADPPGTLNFRSGRSDGRGELRIPGALAAVHTLRISAEGFLPFESELELPAGIGFTHEVELAAGSSSHGIVLNADDSPAPGVQVWAQPDQGYPGWWPGFFQIPKEHLRTTSAEDGSFRVGGMEAGKRYRLMAQRGRAWTASEMAEPSDGFVLRLPPVFSVRGKLTFPDGKAAAGAKVGFNDLRWPDMAHRLRFHIATADPEGYFETELPPGRFGMAAFHPEGEHFFEAPVEVEREIDLGPVTLPYGCALEILVVDAATGKPITGWLGGSVRDNKPVKWALDGTTWRAGLLDYSRTFWDEASPDFICPGDGTMRLNQLGPGEHKLSVYATDYFRTPCKVNLVRGELTRMTVALERQAEVRIHLTDSAGLPAVGRSLLLSPVIRGEHIALPSGTTGPDGVAHIREAKAGAYRVMLADSVREVIAVVKVQPGENEFAVQIPFVAPLTILVEDGNGPVAGAEVRLRRRRGMVEANGPAYEVESPRAQTGPNGLCTFEGQKAGEFLIHAWKEESFPAWLVADFETPDQVIRIPLGTSSVSGTVAEAPPGTEVLLLEASLSYVDEDTLLWLLQISVDEGFDRFEPDSSSFATAKVRCDERGGFLFDRVPDGRFFLTATAPDYLPAPLQEFLVQGGSVRGRKLRLEAAGRVVVRTENPEEKMRGFKAVRPDILLKRASDGRIVRSSWELAETTIFEKIPPGAYLFQVSVRRENSSKVLFELPANVEAGETCELLWPGGG